MTKQEFDKKYVRGNTVVHCATKELVKEFLTVADRFGYRWKAGDRYIDISGWGLYKEVTCYDIAMGEYADVKYYNSIGANIIEFKGFDKKKDSSLIDVLQSEINKRYDEINILQETIGLLIE